MIVNIRGTGGSGKSTVVRRVMELYSQKLAIQEPGRRQPYGYVLHRTVGTPEETVRELPARWGKPLYVVGHYETPCGGGDTISNVGAVFSSVVEHAPTHDVLFEGIISQDDTSRTIDISRSFPLLVIFLTTSLADSLAGIQKRRDERGDDRPLNSKNTESRMKRCLSHYSKLRDSKVECIKLDREAAYQEVVRRLGL